MNGGARGVIDTARRPGPQGSRGAAAAASAETTLMHPRLWMIPLLCLAGAGALGFGWAASGAVETALRKRIVAATQAGGHGWARLAVDGATATLAGESPDADAAAAALAAARGAAPWAQIGGAFTLAPAPAVPPAPELGIEILVEPEGAALAGRAPDAASADALAAALDAGSQTPPRTNLLTVGDGPAPPGWAVAQEAGAAAALGLRQGRVSLAPGSLSVVGIPASEEKRIGVERLARALRAAGMTVSIDLAAPAVAAGVAVIDVELKPSGPIVRACSAPDASAAQALTVALSRLAAEEAICGGPPNGTANADWAVAAEAGLGALARVGAGRFRLEDRLATFAPRAEVEAGVAAAAAAQLAAALPPAFALRFEGGAAAPARAAIPEASVWLRAQAGADVVLVTGAAPDIATRAAVLSYAAAAFGADRVHDGMALASGPGAEGWRTAALAGLEALATLDAGAVEVAGGAVSLRGVSREPLAARDAHAALGPAAARGWRTASRVTIDLPARAAEALLPPGECLARLNATVGETPLAFAPASAEIAPADEPTLDTLADTLRRCARAVIEVGGHTDSQGSAGYNLALSQARAEAVRAALLARGTAPGALVARGYGQTEPVADNATEEGRARNRRIAFDLRGQEAEAAAAAAVPAESHGEASDTADAAPAASPPETRP